MRDVLAEEEGAICAALERDHAEIFTLERRRCEALPRVDLAVLDEIFDDSLTHVHTTGLVHDKLAFLENLQKKRVFVEVRRRDLEVRVFGDTAVLTGPMCNTVLRPGDVQPSRHYAYVTQVLRYRNQTWRFVAFHACARPGDAW